MESWAILLSGPLLLAEGVVALSVLGRVWSEGPPEDVESQRASPRTWRPVSDSNR